MDEDTKINLGGNSLYSGYYNEDLIDKVTGGRIKVNNINCCILETESKECAAFQKARSEWLGKGAAKVVFVDHKNVIMEQITPITRWYEKKRNDYMKKNTKVDTADTEKWVHHFLPILINMLRYIMKSLANWYISHKQFVGKGNWLNMIGVNQNDEGRLFNFNSNVFRYYPDELHSLLKLIDSMLKRDVPSYLRVSINLPRGRKLEYDPFQQADFMDKVSMEEAFMKRYQDPLFANFIINLRTIIENGYSTDMSPKTELLALLYGSVFWSDEERITFMQSVFDFAWSGCYRKYILSFNIGDYYNDDWQWASLVDKDPHLKKVYEGTDLSEDMRRPKYDFKNKFESVRFWRNCRHHFNHKQIWDANEIEENLDKRVKICGHTFFAICSFIMDKDWAFWNGYPWHGILEGFKSITGRICQN